MSNKIHRMIISEPLFPSILESPSHVERQLERLLCVQSRIAVRMIPALQVRLFHRAAAADALCDVLPSHLEVHATRNASHLLVDIKESLDLPFDVIEPPRLISIAALRVSVHGIAHPRHHLPSLLDRLDQGGEHLAQLCRAHPHDDADASRRVVRIERSDETHKLARVHLITHFHADRVTNALHERHVRVVQLPGPLSAPQVVPGAAIVQASRRVLPGQRGLVVQEEALVRHEELRLLQLAQRVDTARLHERDRILHPRRQLHILLPLVGGLHKLQLPVGDAVQSSIPTRGERTHQVQRRRRLVIRLHQPVRIGHAGLRRELRAVDDVPTVRRQLLPIDGFQIRRPWLGKLTCQPRNLHHRHATPVLHHHTHLQQQPVQIPHFIRRELLKALRTIPSLHQKRLPPGSRREAILQRARLPGKHQRRHTPNLPHRGPQRLLVGIIRLLQRREITPGFGRPVVQVRRAGPERHRRRRLGDCPRDNGRA
mmetsp:Transcript_12871/g.36896  ORF Transcript_12871/g.36896 Transcript_12871/m.36896 type:complete len:485 (-) Transcript_12871:221-1675(-)